MILRLDLAMPLYLPMHNDAHALHQMGGKSLLFAKMWNSELLHMFQFLWMVRHKRLDNNNDILGTPKLKQNKTLTHFQSQACFSSIEYFHIFVQMISFHAN